MLRVASLLLLALSACPGGGDGDKHPDTADTGVDDSGHDSDTSDTDTGDTEDSDDTGDTADTDDTSDTEDTSDTSPDDDWCDNDEDGDGMSINDGDCRPVDRAAYSGADEDCNGRDDDCDGEIDEDDVCTWYTSSRVSAAAPPPPPPPPPPDTAGDTGATDTAPPDTGTPVPDTAPPDTGVDTGDTGVDTGDTGVDTGTETGGETAETGTTCDRIELRDNDRDGVTVCDGDCNDGDPNAYPGNSEACYDGHDNDCDGDVDEDCEERGEGSLWLTGSLAACSEDSFAGGTYALEIRTDDGNSVCALSATLVSDDTSPASACPDCVWSFNVEFTDTVAVGPFCDQYADYGWVDGYFDGGFTGFGFSPYYLYDGTFPLESVVWYFSGTDWGLFSFNYGANYQYSEAEGYNVEFARELDGDTYYYYF